MIYKSSVSQRDVITAVTSLSFKKKICKDNHKPTDEFVLMKTVDETVNCQQYKGQWGHTKQQVHKSIGSSQRRRRIKKKETLTRNTNFDASQPRKLGKTALYWTLVVTKQWEEVLPRVGGVLGRSLGVTCTFLFEALCFSASPDPSGCRWPFSALLFSWLSSFLSPPAIIQIVKIKSWPKIMKHSYYLSVVMSACAWKRHLSVQLSFFLFELCQTES